MKKWSLPQEFITMQIETELQLLVKDVCPLGKSCLRCTVEVQSSVDPDNIHALDTMRILRSKEGCAMTPELFDSASKEALENIAELDGLDLDSYVGESFFT